MDSSSNSSGSGSGSCCCCSDDDIYINDLKGICEQQKLPKDFIIANPEVNKLVQIRTPLFIRKFCLYQRLQRHA